MAHGSCIPRIAIVARVPQDDQNRLHSFSGVDTRICSSCGTKKEKTMARYQSEMISNLQSDHLLWPVAGKVNDIRTFLEVGDFDSDR